MAKQEIERRGLVAMLAGAIIAVTGPSLADEAIDPQAKDAITKMGKTLSTGAFSFQSNTIRQYKKTTCRFTSSTPHRYWYGVLIV